jgi:NitT/TauT family transport system substrate-binding protein
MISARARGLPVVGVASIMPRSPQAIISLAETGIARPQDLAGHKIAVALGGADLTLDNLLQSQGVNRDDVEIVERTFFGVEPLVNGEVDGFVGWIINEGVALEEQGQEPQYIFMSDYGVDTYEFVVFTTDTIVAEKPELVQGVVNAILKGVQDTIDDPAAAIEHTLTYDETLVKEDQLRRLEATIPLINVPGIAPGSMDERVWQFTYDLLDGQGMLEGSFELGDVYTLAFIPTASE